jgi:hypothetical protein
MLAAFAADVLSRLRFRLHILLLIAMHGLG